MFIHYLAIFFISVLCIVLELFLTRILNLKAWNHLVYIIIPYAILGYGIGANACLLLRSRLAKSKPDHVLGILLIISSVFALLTPLLLIAFPLQLQDMLNIFTSFKSMGMLLIAYSIITLPFLFIGFLVVYLFTVFPNRSNILYFWDLLGAGLGAYLFYPMINSTQVIHSIAILSLIGIFFGLAIRYPYYRHISMFLVMGAAASIFMLPEPQEYRIDMKKGWEYVPGFYKPSQYEQKVSRWHALGRTDIFRMTDPAAREHLYNKAKGTFEINIVPLPEFAYISTNFLAGSPIFSLAPTELAKQNSKVELFTQGMEFPYTLLNKPRVLIIGTGGGRDIFMAHTHGAANVIGAEINPGIYKELSPGGKMYDYSHGIYTLNKTQVFNVDGRQLVKRQPSQSRDLIILNGVDTFSGLSSGAYAYAESYLYTKEAVKDYLRVLSDGGMINFNRWFFPGRPREDLRLFAIIMEALKDMKAERPGDHIILGSHDAWAMFLVKKTPFTPEEKEKIYAYFQSHRTALIYPELDKTKDNFFDLYVQNFDAGRTDFFLDNYPFDVSVITDDKPFFYKYYKLSELNIFRVLAYHHTGTVIFFTQALVLIQSVVFILLFIVLPLYVFKSKDIQVIPAKGRMAFIAYFACLGIGFMFIEIALMQRFVMLLGSPIYAISVTLAALLVSSGIGSALLPRMQSWIKVKAGFIPTISAALCVLIVLLIAVGMSSLDALIGLAFWARTLIVCLILLPIGLLLGVFFPAGLNLLTAKNHQGAIAWAWGLNCGFTVLGSILTIIFSQFLGFNFILGLACVVYLAASQAFDLMNKEIN